MTAIKLFDDPVHPQRTKYYRISQSYVRWCSNSNLIKLEYLASKEHPCDLLNKAVPKPSFLKHRPALMGEVQGGVVMMARWKQCCRLVPTRVRQRIRSKSDGAFPLVARCAVCRQYVPWLRVGQRWSTCVERNVLCDSNNIQVYCFSCEGEASYSVSLDRWFCASCIEDEELYVPVGNRRSIRRRIRTRRFQGYAE